MPVLQRNNAPRGPRFYKDDGKLLFVNILDGSTREGPRPATADDKATHAEAFEVFKSGEEPAFPGSKPLVSFVTPEKTPETAA